MSKPTHPKTAVIVIVNRFTDQWISTYNKYSKKLDRVDGQLQWTPEAIEVLDTIHDTLIQNINDELKHYDLNTRTAFDAYCQEAI